MSLAAILTADPGNAVPIEIVPEGEYGTWLAAQDDATRAQLAAQRFEGKRYTQALRFDSNGRLAGAVVGVRANNDVWALGNAALTLPPQAYTLGSALPAGTQQRLALGFALGAYQFLRYKPKAARPLASLVLEPEAERTAISRIAGAVHGARDRQRVERRRVDGDRQVPLGRRVVGGDAQPQRQAGQRGQRAGLGEGGGATGVVGVGGREADEAVVGDHGGGSAVRCWDQVARSSGSGLSHASGASVIGWRSPRCAACSASRGGRGRNFRAASPPCWASPSTGWPSSARCRRIWWLRPVSSSSVKRVARPPASTARSRTWVIARWPAIGRSIVPTSAPTAPATNAR